LVGVGEDDGVVLGAHVALAPLPAPRRPLVHVPVRTWLFGSNCGQTAMVKLRWSNWL
jgi:hypothetical protein